MEEDDSNSYVIKVLADERVQVAMAQIVQTELEQITKNLRNEAENEKRKWEMEKAKQVGELNTKLETAEENVKSLNEELKRLKGERVEVDEKLKGKDKQLEALKEEMFDLSAAYGELNAKNLYLERLVDKMKKEEEPAKMDLAVQVSPEAFPVVEEQQNAVESLMEEDIKPVVVGVLETAIDSKSEMESVPNDVPVHIPERRRSLRMVKKKCASPKATGNAAACQKPGIGRSSLRKKATVQNKDTSKRVKRGTRTEAASVEKHVSHGFLKYLKNGRLVCKCGDDFASRRGLSNHALLRNSGKRLSCPNCTHRCFDAWNLKRHIRRKHFETTENN